VKFNPVDGLPEWKGRKVVTELQKARAAKRARRFVVVEWGVLVSIMAKPGFPRHIRLLFVLLLHQKMRMVQSNNGWVELRRADLIDVNLANSNFYKAVTGLEGLGLVEVQRRPGKRPLLRLITDPAPRPEAHG
jgi:hypothetical protein